MADLSIVILTHNSWNHLSETLDILSGENVILLDDYSTQEAPKKYQNKVKVFKHKLDNNWAEHKNAVLSEITTSHVLFLDDDEILNEALLNEIKKELNSPDSINTSYSLRRIETISGQTLNHGQSDNYYLRLFPVEKGKWIRDVHELVEVDTRIKVKKLKTPLLHKQRSSISDFLNKINFYSEIDKKYFRPNLLDWFKPVIKSIYLLVFKGGIFDGLPGIFSAFLMSFYSLTLRVKTNYQEK